MHLYFIQVERRHKKHLTINYHEYGSAIHPRVAQSNQTETVLFLFNSNDSYIMERIKEWEPEI
ncbi:hypothetical protein bthur0009_54160 [Bacillus thuringiensis serovar andalousiensis BGSC 4AW1]|nr:hypothetical protein bthur0009_54160 [Bacillus thuringiensis serovar andalousiensis BGSC 4AW1]OUB04179.1 hypothetical protein BK714_00710 [Bacillus thuringiensis serovar oswaldocruzi]